MKIVEHCGPSTKPGLKLVRLSSIPYGVPYRYNDISPNGPVYMRVMGEKGDFVVDLSTDYCVRVSDPELYQYSVPVKILDKAKLVMGEE